MLILLRNCHTVFQSGCMVFHSYQHYRRILISSHAANILYYSTLVNVKWYLDVILICISLMTNAIEHIFMYYLVICISDFEKCLLISFTQF